MRKITQELIAEIRKLKVEGNTHTKIAELVGVSRTTVGKYCKAVLIEDIVGVPITSVKLSKKELKKILKTKNKEAKKLRKALKKANK